jgi:hypothetical protein
MTGLKKSFSWAIFWPSIEEELLLKGEILLEFIISDTQPPLLKKPSEKILLLPYRE